MIFTYFAHLNIRYMKKTVFSGQFIPDFRYLSTCSPLLGDYWIAVSAFISDESGMALNQRRALELQTLRHENNNMNRLLLKMKALTNWRLNSMREHHQGTVCF